MKEPLISEILTEANNKATRDETVKVLKQHNSLGLRDVLRASFDDTIVFDLPQGAPKYQSPESTDGTMPSNLIRRTGELAYLVKGGPGKNLHPARREALFIGLIEGIDPRDADMLILMKDKKLSTKWTNITKEAVKLAFPTLIKK